MATRILEPLVLDDDPYTIENWLERFESATAVALFETSDKLPTDNAEKLTQINTLKKQYLTSSLGPATYKLLKSYCRPQKISEMPYADLA